jgi:outer membrane protein assembly factor BamB
MLWAALVNAGDNWPQFRGPTGDGQVGSPGLPLTWSETENVAWKTPIHGRGWSSPVVWGNQIWLTTATETGHEMFALCVDRTTGKILFDLKIFDVAQPQEIHAFNSYASPTPVIEAGRVWVHFGSYGTKCLDTASGKTIWVRRDLECDHYRGPGSSPVIFEELLILTFDGIDVQYLVALDKNTGQTVWRTDRSTDFGDLDGDNRKSYTTPALVEVDGRWQLISPGAQAAFAYDARTGEELWMVRYSPGFSNVSRPLFCNGLVLINTGFSKAQLWAVRPDGRGDVTESHVVWKVAKSMPAKPTPVIVGGRLYTVDDRGVGSAIDVPTGRVVWQERVSGSHSASPVYADGRIYFFDDAGTTTVIRPGDSLEILAHNELDDGCMGSPAVAGGAMFLRTKTHLYRIEE